MTSTTTQTWRGVDITTHDDGMTKKHVKQFGDVVVTLNETDSVVGVLIPGDEEKLQAFEVPVLSHVEFDGIHDEKTARTWAMQR